MVPGFFLILLQAKKKQTKTLLVNLLNTHVIKVDNRDQITIINITRNQ
jgi:hypothetical protein